jgi:hypothetical protein
MDDRVLVSFFFSKRHHPFWAEIFLYWLFWKKIV